MKILVDYSVNCRLLLKVSCIGLLILGIGPAVTLGQNFVSLSKAPGSNTYTQSLDSIGTSLPAGFTVRTGSSNTSFGSSAPFNTAELSWADTGGAFKNLASADGLTSGSTTANQNASTDRALGLRQSGSFGDPDAAFAVQIQNTIDLYDFTIAFKAQTLSAQTRTTVFTLQYGLGASPSSFTDIGSYTTGSFGSTALQFNLSAFDEIEEQAAAVTFRFAALTASTGSGTRDTVGIDDFSLSYTAAPEPTTAALFGLCGSLLLGRRRRHAAGGGVMGLARRAFGRQPGRVAG